jgi:hypothetical protein
MPPLRPSGDARNVTEFSWDSDSFRGWQEQFAAVRSPDHVLQIPIGVSDTSGTTEERSLQERE